MSKLRKAMTKANKKLAILKKETMGENASSINNLVGLICLKEILIDLCNESGIGLPKKRKSKCSSIK